MLFQLCQLTLLLAGVSAYNLDVQNPKIFEDPTPTQPWTRNSYFGFSVALYAPPGGDPSSSLLLVGAPRANSSRTGDWRDRVIEPGAVYRCGTESVQGICAEWLVDSTPDNRIFGLNAHFRQKKDYAWLGATIQVENSTTPRVAVCAPNWKKNVFGDYFQAWYMEGMCYSTTANNSLTFSRGDAKRHFPLIDNDRQVITHGGVNLFYYGTGQAGFSMHLTPGTRNMVLGAPGVFHWTGATMTLSETAQRNSYDALIPDVINDVHFQYDDYFGYSVTSGYYYNEGERLYASGAPRSSNMMGKVFIYTFPERKREKLLFKSSFEGEQYGEYFGSSLATCDINNDGRDDLIIGAPQWSKVTDEGRVYVYISKGKTDFEIQRIDGESVGGRFGTTVTCLGDMDYDGYADVAVGSPYEDEERGSIRVFHGRGTGGLDLRHAQHIRASDLSPGLRGFGVSIAEPRDVDGNRYADLAVGAYLSGHAVLLKARPIVTINIKVLRSENFTLMQNSTHFFVDACSVYNGAFVPDTLKIIQSLKIDEFHKRVIIYQSGRLFGNIYNITSTLSRGKITCNHVKINLKKNIQNMIDPIEIAASVKINEDNPCPNCPIINPMLSSTTDNLKVAYLLDCGTDDICISDLHVNITSDLSSNNRYIIGSKSNVNVNIFVENTREPAYRAQVHVYIPEPIALAKIPQECDEQIRINNTLEIICNLGNPLRYNNTLLMELDMGAIRYTDEYNEIQIVATTQSEEKNAFDNIGSLRIDYDIDADMDIIGKSYEDLYSYFEKDVNEKKYEKFTFQHIYEIWKFGLTPIEEAVVILNVPTHWKNNEIARINNVRGSIDQHRYNCEIIASEESNSSIILSDNQSLYEGNNSLVMPPEARTFYVNCTDSDTVCKTFRCKLGPFTKAQMVAKLTVNLNFQLSNVTADAVKRRDIIFFVSEGFVEITQPNVTIEFANKRPDFKQISTSFISYRVPEEIPIWIIVLSVLLGIVLLALLSLLLYKLGFFNRQRKEDLDTLRSKEEINLNDDGNENMGATAEIESLD